MNLNHSNSKNEKGFQHVVVGGDYFAFIYAHILRFLHPNDSIMLVYQKGEHHLGSLFGGTLNQLDRKVLEQLGRQLKLTPLENLNSYLSPVESVYQIDERILYRSPDVATNMRELSRKLNLNMGQMLKQSSLSEVEQLLNLMAKELMQKAFSLKKNREENSTAPLKTRALWKKILSTMEFPVDFFTDERLLIANFLSKASHFGLLDRKPITRTDWFSFLLFILPHYRLESEALAENLKQTLQLKNIILKENKVESWQLGHKRGDEAPSELLLSGHEGLVEAKEIHYIGNPHLPTPFYAETSHNKFFVSYKLQVKLEKKWASFLPARLLSANSESFCSDYPLSVLNKEGDNTFSFYSFVRRNSGQKASFYLDVATKNLHHSLSLFVPAGTFEFAGQSMRDGYDKWPEGEFESGIMCAHTIGRQWWSLLGPKKVIRPKGLSVENRDEINHLSIWSSYTPGVEGGVAGLMGSWPNSL